jgi:hypothetical protein
MRGGRQMAAATIASRRFAKQKTQRAADVGLCKTTTAKPWVFGFLCRFCGGQDKTLLTKYGSETPFSLKTSLCTHHDFSPAGRHP